MEKFFENIIKENQEENVLTPKALIETGFINKERQSSLVEKISINPDFVVRDIKKEIPPIVEKSKIVFFGIDHASSISHLKISEFLSVLPKNRRIGVFVEYPPSIQENIDEFLKTGNFLKSDDNTLYQKIYDYVKDGGLSRELPEYLTGTFFDSRPALIEMFPVLEKAKELNLNIIAGDEYHDSSVEDDSEMLKRDESMFKILKASVEEFETTIVVVGANHSLNSDYELEVGSYPYKTKEKIPSVAKLSKEYWGDSEVVNFYLENQLHNNRYAESQQVVSSALFEAMKKFAGDGQNVGLKIQEGSIDKISALSEQIGADYYVPVYN